MIEFLKINIFIVEYRGYGKSTGTPSEDGIQIDAQSALNYILKHEDVDPNKIFVFGRSLGGAVAIDLASRNPDSIKALVVENTFTSVPSMVDVLFPVLKYFKFLSRNQWFSEEKIKHIQIPTLFLSGRKDQLIPPSMMDKLFESCGSVDKNFEAFENGYHEDTWNSKGYYQKFSNWVEKKFNWNPK